VIGLFLLWWYLGAARLLGSVLLTDIAGGGWQCTIRPPHVLGRRNRVNSWHARGRTMGHALRAAVREAIENPPPPANGDARTAPKLGLEEFDT